MIEAGLWANYISPIMELSVQGNNGFRAPPAAANNPYLAACVCLLVYPFKPSIGLMYGYPAGNSQPENSLS